MPTTEHFDEAAPEAPSASKANMLELRVNYKVELPEGVTRDEAIQFIQNDLRSKAAASVVMAYMPTGVCVMREAAISSAVILDGIPEQVRRPLQAGVKAEMEAAQPDDSPEAKDEADKAEYKHPSA